MTTTTSTPIPMTTPTPTSTATAARRRWRCSAMLDHNVHHAAELGDLAKEFSGEVAHQLMHAVEAFDQANGYLSAALDMLEK